MKPTESADVHADRHVSAVHVEHHDRIGPTWPTDLSPLFAAAPANLGVEHDPRWMAALQQALGHEPHVLIARDDAGNMTGYLPMALVSSRWFGRMLVSLPYVNRAGVVASDAAVAHGLIEHATALAGRLGVDYLELRHSIPVDHQAFNASRQDKVLMTMPLPADDQALWDQLRSKVRSHIRGGRRQIGRAHV